MGRDALRKCISCEGETSIEDFYGNRNQCKKCYTKRVIDTDKNTVLSKTERKQNRKRKLIEELGGKCYDCGLITDYISVYDFHHIDEKTKTGNVSKLIKSTSFEIVLEEARKCLLLCANCHRILHEKEWRFKNEQ